MTRALASLAAAALTLSVLGCGSTSTTDGGAGGASAGGAAGGDAGGTSNGGGTGGGSALPPIALNDYCTEARATECSFAVRCGRFAPNAPCDKLFETSPLSNNQPDCLYPRASGLDAGFEQYDAQMARQCFTDVRLGSTCGLTYTDGVASCSGIFTPQRNVGDTCFVTADCVSGAWCDSSSTVCPGLCQPRVDAGSLYSNALSCAVGSYPLSGRCQPLVAAGDSCRPPDAGTALSLACAPGAFCDQTSYLCTPYKGPGELCGSPFQTQCKAGLNCVDQRDGGARCATPSRAGEACQSGRAAPPQYCLYGLGCSNAADGGSCGPMHTAGEPCGGANGACEVGLHCVIGNGGLGFEGVCAAWLGVDAGCTGSLDCAYGLSCPQLLDGGQRRCTPSLGRGESCGGLTAPSCGPNLACLRPADAGAFTRTCLPLNCQ